MPRTKSAVAVIDPPTSIEELDDDVLAVIGEDAPPSDLALAQRVPWKIVEHEWDQRREITQWADDWGAYPQSYRSYSREEWTQAINLLADVVEHLPETNPEYQRTTGVYVEEHTDDLLLLRAKKFSLLIQIPAKSTTKGKTFELKQGVGGQAYWGSDEDRATQLAELLSMAPREDRDVLLNICCQYLREVRIRVNKQTWCDQNQDIAYLIKGQKD